MSDLDVSEPMPTSSKDTSSTGTGFMTPTATSDRSSSDAWWETPLSDYRSPVAVEPSIYGLDDDSATDVRDEAIISGTNAPATKMPFLDEVQASFGARHRIDAVLAHSGAAATAAADDLGANAFAAGSHVVFGGAPDLWTAAHETTHLVQQSSGVRPADGLGSADDTHEQRADAVADLVVRGASASALLADYASFQLDQSVTRPGPAGSLVQLDRKVDQTSSAPAPSAAPSKASDASAFAFLAQGEDAVEKYTQGAEYANALYEVVKDQASMKATHEKIDVAYKDASKQREKMMEVSTLEKLIGGVTAVVDFATSLSGLISAARTLHAAASLRPISKRIAAREGTRDDHLREHELRGTLAGKSKVKAVGDALKGMDGVRKGLKKAADVGSDPDATLDVDTMLPNVNAAAINAGNDALMSWAKSGSKLDFLGLQHYGRSGALAYKHMVEGIALIAKEGTPLTDQSFDRYQSIIAKFDAARDSYIAAVERVRQLMVAFEAGGAAGIADAREHDVFSTIQKWKYTNDPHAKALRFALDQDSKSVHFDGATIDMEARFGGGTVTHYYCYPYREQAHRTEDATLFVSNGPTATELVKLGLAYAPVGPFGDAEKTEETPGSGIKFAISASIAKAIESLGIPGTANQARVQFYTSSGAPLGAVTNKHRGAWFDDWRSTSEFASFWKTHLGGQYAYLLAPDGKRQTIPAAVGDSKVMERSAVSQAVQGGVL